MADSQQHRYSSLNQNYPFASTQLGHVQGDLGIMQHGEEAWQRAYGHVIPQFDNTIASREDVSIPGAIDFTEDNVRRLHVVPQLKYYVGEHNTPVYDPITFRCGGRDGVPLCAVENRSYAGLEDPQALITFGDRVKISHRLRVIGLGGTGYTFDKQVPSRRATAGGDYLTRLKIAYHVAKSVRECMAISNGMWTISNGVTLRCEDLVLVDMKNVSEGSWQPTLGYYA